MTTITDEQIINKAYEHFGYASGGRHQTSYSEHFFCSKAALLEFARALLAQQDKKE